MPRRFVLPNAPDADAEDEVLEVATGGRGGAGMEDFGALANGDRIRQPDPEDLFGEDAGEDDLDDGGGFGEVDGGDDEADGFGPGVREPRPDDFGLDADVQEQAQRIRGRKMEILRKLNDLAARGVPIPEDLSMKTHVDDLEYHLTTLERKIGLQSSLKFQKRLLMAAVSGLEFLNREYGDYTGLHLDGWSNQVYATLPEYDGVMERLWEKYRNKVQAPPELEVGVG